MTDAATPPSSADAAVPVPSRLERLHASVRDVLGGRIQRLETALGELTLTVRAADLLSVALSLRDAPALRFEQLQDLCGMDYSGWRDEPWDGPRFGVVVHLLSIGHNWRLRLKVTCPDDDVPVVPSLTGVWSSANWFEREAFDLFGIIFDGHTDLRRILTDYGFIGHPFRKDFPVSGDVEMRYDPEQRRVIYQPVTIEPREVTPRIIREDNYAGTPSGRPVRDPA